MHMFPRFFLPNLFIFSTLVFPIKTGVFDVSESLDALQTNCVISDRLDPADLHNNAKAISRSEGCLWL